MLPRTIKKRAMFLNVTRQGTSVRTKGIVAVCRRLDVPYSLVGYTASRKVGSAVERNFAKRRMRALVREFCDKFLPGYAFVFIANANTVGMRFADLKADFVYSLTKSRDSETRYAR